MIHLGGSERAASGVKIIECMVLVQHMAFIGHSWNYQTDRNDGPDGLFFDISCMSDYCCAIM